MFLGLRLIEDIKITGEKAIAETGIQAKIEVTTAMSQLVKEVNRTGDK